MDKALRATFFCQAWDATQTLNPPNPKDMMKVGRKRGVRMDGFAFSRDTMLYNETIIKSRATWGHFNIGG
jgi:hypothetical protein